MTAGFAGLDICLILTSVAAYSAGTASEGDPALASLKAQGLVCDTLAEWLQQQLANSSAQGAGQLQLGQHAALSRVLVVEEWTDKLNTLLAAPNNRQLEVPPD
jgi:hypothetical protein